MSKIIFVYLRKPKCNRATSFFLARKRWLGYNLLFMIPDYRSYVPLLVCFAITLKLHCSCLLRSIDVYIKSIVFAQF